MAGIIRCINLTLLLLTFIQTSKAQNGDYSSRPRRTFGLYSHIGPRGEKETISSENGAKVAVFRQYHQPRIIELPIYAHLPSPIHSKPPSPTHAKPPRPTRKPPVKKPQGGIQGRGGGDDDDLLGGLLDGLLGGGGGGGGGNLVGGLLGGGGPLTGLLGGVGGGLLGGLLGGGLGRR